jgi:hypothetical protein
MNTASLISIVLFEAGAVAVKVAFSSPRSSLAN